MTSAHRSRLRGNPRRGRRGICAGAAVAAALLLATPAFAQYGQIEGTVADSTGAVLPGATVTATNDATGVSRSAVTDAGGGYRLPALLPGAWSVTAELTGFGTVVNQSVALSIQQTIVMNFEMGLAQVEEMVTVTGAAPLLDTRRSDVSTSVSDLQIQDLPVASRRWVDLALLTPGTSQDAIRGFYYRGNVNMGGGGRYYANGFIVDGVNNTWAEMGEARQNFPMDAIGEFQITTSNFKAEYGLATGGLMTVVTKSGTNNFAGSGFWFFRDRSLTELTYQQKEFAADDPDFEEPAYRRHQFGGSLGGPIREDRTHFFFAYERTNEELFYDISTGGVFPEHEGTFPKDEWRYMWLARINHQVNEDHSVWLRVAWENEYRPNLNARGITTEGFDFAVPRNAEVVGWTWVAGEDALNEFRFQRAFSKYEVSPAFSAGSYDAGDFSDERLGLCDVNIRRPNLRTGSCNDQMGPEYRWQFKDDLTLFRQGFGGTHQLKLGFDYNWIDFSADIVNNYAGTFTFDTNAPFDTNDPDTYPIQYSQSQPRYDEVPVHHFSVYAQDDWVSDRLTLNLGLRYDLQSGTFNEDITSIQFPIPVPFHDGADRRGDLNNLGPRIGFVYDLSREGTGRTTVKGGYGKFFENIRTLTNFGERWWHQASTIIINDPDFLDPLGGRSREEYLSTAAPNITILDNDYEQPYAHHFNVGVAHQLGETAALSLDLTRVMTRADAMRRVNLNYAIDGVRPYPQFRRVDATYSLLDHDYSAFYAKFEKRYSDNWQFLVSYTLAKSDSTELWTRNTNPSGWHPEFPGYTEVTRPGDTDRRHRLVSSGILTLPGDIRLSAILDYRSPLPVRVDSGTNLNGDDYGGDLAPGFSADNAYGCRNLDLSAANAYRQSIGQAAASGFECSNFLNVDFRASWGMYLGIHRFEVVAQALNVFDRANFDTPVGNLRSGSFGENDLSLASNINAPSRQFELALRYSF